MLVIRNPLSNKFKLISNRKIRTKVFEYIFYFILDLKTELLQTNILLTFYGILNPYQKEALNSKITNFLDKHQNLLDVLDLSLKFKKNKRSSILYEFMDFPYKISYRESGNSDQKEKIVEINFRDFSKDYEMLVNFVLSLPKNNQLEFIQEILLQIKEFLKEEKVSDNQLEIHLRRKIESLNEYFHFTNEEVEILIFIYYLNTFQIVQEIFEELLEFYDLIKVLSLLTRVNEKAVKDILNRNSKLQFFQILYLENSTIQMNEEIYDYLNELSGYNFLERFFSILDPSKEEILDLKLFSFQKEKIEILKELLSCDGTVNILFYGKTGAGKTSLAKSLIHSLGKKIIYVTNEFLKDRSYFEIDPTNRIMSLILANQYAKQNNGVVIMDEADEFLNSHFSLQMYYFLSNKSTSIKKNWLNHFLEQHGGKIVWISNYIELMDESVKRRFQYSLQFTSFNGEVREKIIEILLKKYDLNQIIKVKDLQEYWLDSIIPIGILENSLKQVGNISKKKKLQKNKLLQYTKELIESSFRLVNNANYKSKKSKVPYFYKEKYINCTLGTETIKERIRKFLHSNKNKKKNLNILFYGPTGTGKTEFAKYLVEFFQLRLIEIQPSDVNHPLFGVSEKLIREYFYAASTSNSLLLVNEIELFLGNPSNNLIHTIKMEFMQNLENFKGIFIGTTNFVDKMGRSALRRFHLKIEFFPIRKSDLEEIFLEFFKDQLPHTQLTLEQKKQLKSIDNLSFGDFYSVKRQIEHEGEIFFEEILRLLKEEVNYRLHQKN